MPGPAALALGLALLLWLAGSTVLLVFAAVLLPIAVRGLGSALAHWTGLSQGMGVASVTILALAFAVAADFAATPRLAEQFGELWDQMGRLERRFEDAIGSFAWVRDVLGLDADAADGVEGMAQAAAGRIASAGVVALGVLANGLFVLVVGLFLAANPSVYCAGLVALVPVAHRPRAREVLKRVGDAVRWWLLGQLVSMAVLAS